MDTPNDTTADGDPNTGADTGPNLEADTGADTTADTAARTANTAKLKGCLVNVALFVVGAIVGTGLTATAAVLLFLPSTTLISTNEGTPNVYVKERSSLMGGTDHEVWLGRTPDYGHLVRIPAGWDTSPEIDRRDDGVELGFDNGGRIFVPEASYLGGR